MAQWSKQADAVRSSAQQAVPSRQNRWLASHVPSALRAIVTCFLLVPASGRSGRAWRPGLPVRLTRGYTAGRFLNCVNLRRRRPKFRQMLALTSRQQ